MAIEQITRKHIFTFVWTDDGDKQGASIIELMRFEEDGVAVAGSTRILDAKPIFLEDTAKLEEIGAAINTSSLAENELKAIQITALEADKVALETEVMTLQNSLTETNISLSTMQTAIDNLQVQLASALASQLAAAGEL